MAGEAEDHDTARARAPWDTTQWGRLGLLPKGSPDAVFRCADQHTIALDRGVESNDLEVVAAWLQRFVGRKNTQNAYRKEVERLLLWADRVKGKALSDLGEGDLIAFYHFLVDPKEPREVWVAERPYPHEDERWRPFQCAPEKPGGDAERDAVQTSAVRGTAGETDEAGKRRRSTPKRRRKTQRGQLTEESADQSLAALSALFSYLVRNRYLTHNPAADARRVLGIHRHRREARPKSLSEPAWDAVMAYVEQMEEGGRLGPEKKARARWVLEFCYAVGARASEAVGATTKSLRRVQKEGRPAQWWWRVQGKGGKVEDLPFTPRVVGELQRYRIGMGWPAIPSSDEKTPLIPKLKGAGYGPDAQEPISRTSLLRLVQSLLGDAAEWIEKQPDMLGLDSGDIGAIRSASTHWIRHTSITHQVNRDPDIRYAQALARHSDLRTTQLYVTVDQDEMFARISAGIGRRRSAKR